MIPVLSSVPVSVSARPILRDAYLGTSAAGTAENSSLVAQQTPASSIEKFLSVAINFSQRVVLPVGARSCVQPVSIMLTCHNFNACPNVTRDVSLGGSDDSVYSSWARRVVNRNNREEAAFLLLRGLSETCKLYSSPSSLLFFFFCCCCCFFFFFFFVFFCFFFVFFCFFFVFCLFFFSSSFSPPIPLN